MLFKSPWILVAAASLLAAPAAAQVTVTFQVNDAIVKDRVLKDVAIAVTRGGKGDDVASGKTDSAGQLTLKLAPGRYLVSYRLAGYVPIERTTTEVSGTAQVVTTTLSPMLEAVGQADKRRIQIVLNWGSREEQARDLDSHLTCACRRQWHVYFGLKKHRSTDHSASLDVDDTDWAGPETITILDPPPGRYTYWVHNYRRPGPTLGASGAVVRVVFGDRVAGEYRVPDVARSRVWKPFRAIEVDAALEPRVVPFTVMELAGGECFIPPPQQTDGLEIEEPRSEQPDTGCCREALRDPEVVTTGITIVLVVVVLLVRRVVRRARR